MYEPPHKMILIGDYGVGKSHLSCRLANDKFGTISQPNCGLYYPIQTFHIDGKKVTLQIWDTVKEERYLCLSPSYLRDAVGALLVYDITRRKSFENLRMWLEQARINCHPEISIVLMGNKADMEKERVISYDEGRKFAEENGLAFLETSSKTGDNVKEAFEKLAELILQKAEAGVLVENQKLMSEIPYYKTLLLGDPNVGKKHLELRLFRNVFEIPNVRAGLPCIGVEYSVKLFDLKGKKLKLQIWKIHQGKYYAILASCYRKAVGACLVYDITRRESFENIANWLNEVKEYSCYDMSEMSIILLGNKVDVENQRVVSYEEGRKFAEENGLVFYETSNKSGESVKRAFEKLAELINEKAESGVFDGKNERAGVKLESNQQASNKGSCACC